MVLPEPGELIRFTASVPLSLKASRNRAAIRSFSLSTFFSIDTLSIGVLFQFEIGQLQFIAPDAPCDVEFQAIGQRFKAEPQRFCVDARILADQYSDFGGAMSGVAPRFVTRRLRESNSQFPFRA